MKHLVTIFIDEKQENAYGPEDWDRLDAGYAAFYQSATDKGWKVEGGALEPPSSAKTLRVRRGELLLTDGPFAETKEWFGGYFVIDGPSLTELLPIVALMPGALSNAVEIRALAQTAPGS